MRREVPYLLDQVNCLACTYLSRDSVGVNSTKVQEKKESLLLSFLRSRASVFHLLRLLLA